MEKINVSNELYKAVSDFRATTVGKGKVHPTLDEMYEALIKKGLSCYTRLLRQEKRKGAK